MKWNIVADSSCDLLKMDGLGDEEHYGIVPLTIRIGEQEFVDDAKLDVEGMMKTMRSYKGSSSSACPSPGDWAEQFMKADNTIAITITSSLSGSYGSAMLAREMVLEEHPEKKILILDSLSAGTELVLAVYKIHELIMDKVSFDIIEKKIKEYMSETHLLFSLASFENLVKSGRMSRILGFVADKLNMRIIGEASEEGKLEILHKVRGEKKTVSMILDEMKKHKFNGSHVVIGHCFNFESAMALKKNIQDLWNGARVTILPTRGLCSFYVEEGGLMVGY